MVDAESLPLSWAGAVGIVAFVTSALQRGHESRMRDKEHQRQREAQEAEHRHERQLRQDDHQHDVFVFDLAYPVGDKSTAGFAAASRDPNLYSSLSRALGLIQRFESDLYENATIPTVLAHRYTAISLRPGGQVLDLLTRRALLAEQ